MSHKLLYVGMFLACLLGGQAYSYASDSVAEATAQQQSNITVKGTVTDSKGEPVVGATVLAGSNTSTIGSHLLVPSTTSLLSTLISSLTNSRLNL